MVTHLINKKSSRNRTCVRHKLIDSSVSKVLRVAENNIPIKPPNLPLRQNGQNILERCFS